MYAGKQPSSSLLSLFKISLIGYVFSTAIPLIAWIDISPGCYAIQGEFLYFSASYDETYFVINGSGVDGLGDPTPNGKRINNPVSYNPGFRLEAGYGFCDSCVDIRSRWTHLYARNRTTVSNFDANPQLWPTEIIPNQPNVAQPFSGTAESQIGVMHQKGEVLFDENLWNLYCFHFTLRQGIEWSYIRYHESVTYTDVNTPSSEKIELHGHTKGIGPQFGIIALCDPCRFIKCWPTNLSFRFLTTASLIAANSKAKIKATNGLVQNKVTQTSFWRFVPEWVIDFGICYSKCFSSFLISCEAGYEVTDYIRGTSKLIFTDGSNPGMSFNQYSDFYVHGLYCSFAVLF